MKFLEKWCNRWLAITFAQANRPNIAKKVHAFKQSSDMICMGKRSRPRKYSMK